MNNNDYLTLIACGLLIVSPFLWGVISRSIYSTKGRSGRTGFWIGFLFGIFGVLVALLVSDMKNKVVAEGAVHPIQNLSTRYQDYSYEDSRDQKDQGDDYWKERDRRWDSEFEEKEKEKKIEAAERQERWVEEERYKREEIEEYERQEKEEKDREYLEWKFGSNDDDE